MTDAESRLVVGLEAGCHIATPINISGGVATYFLPGRLADVVVACTQSTDVAPAAVIAAPWLLDAARHAAASIDTFVVDRSSERALATLTQRAIDDGRLRAAHGALMGRSQPSRYRDAIAWVNGRSPGHAKLVPPPSSAINALISDLIGFLARTDMPVWIKQALAYYQFVHIHPFADGNGRMSRLLVAAIGMTSAATRLRSMIVALALTAHRKAFTQCFDAMQAGASNAYLTLWRNLNDWAGDFAFDVAAREHELRATLSELVGANSAPRLFDRLVHGVALTEQEVATALRWSAKNAPRYFTRLRDAGWVNGSGAGFVAEPVRAAQRELVAQIAERSSTILL